MRKTSLTAAALAAAAALTLSACGGGDDESSSVAEVSAGPTKAATVLDNPLDKPDLVLTDTDGKKYDFIKETKGHPVLLYFGYRHCPDACPFTMSNISLALRKLSPAERKELRVVFVSSDPKRDTPKELGKWLAQNDKSFIGLTGDFDTIQAGARAVNIYLDQPKKVKGTWVSSHSPRVVAFSPKDDKGHAIYDKDTTADEYAKDLPKIIKGGTP
ncbi:SCO family protein [Streptomyces sp. NPDC001922]|uniref:SCO family protein n=1 Tax=unclassified Streptomyces TaxID=2593676 RepID=UPI00369831C8